jgi:hypothetical protein
MLHTARGLYWLLYTQVGKHDASPDFDFFSKFWAMAEVRKAGTGTFFILFYGG